MKASLKTSVALLMCLAATPALANRIFVSNEKGNDVTVIDSETLEVIGHYPVGARPRGITISPDGKELYVCVSDDDLVRVFNPETQARKFDPDGAYVRRWVPELEEPGYPEPIVDHAAERQEALDRWERIRR